MKPTDPKADPNATIQLNLEELSLLRPEDAPASATPGKPRATPPPLPPSVAAQASAPPGAREASFAPVASPSVAPSAPPRSKRSTLLLGAVFVVLLGAVITAGAKLGFALRAAPAPSAAAAPSAAPSAPPGVIIIKTIDLQDPTAPAESAK